MGIAITIIVAGLLGVLGHWYARWAQGRTTNTFKEYLLVNHASTISSFIANLSSSGGIFATLPDDASSKVVFLAVYGAFTAGYALDSTLNRDTEPQDAASNTEPAAQAEPPKPAPKKKSIEEIKNENAKKPLSDLLADDSAE